MGHLPEIDLDLLEPPNTGLAEPIVRRDTEGRKLGGSSLLPRFVVGAHSGTVFFKKGVRIGVDVEPRNPRPEEDRGAKEHEKNEPPNAFNQ